MSLLSRQHKSVAKKESVPNEHKNTEQVMLTMERMKDFTIREPIFM